MNIILPKYRLWIVMKGFFLKGFHGCFFHYVISPMQSLQDINLLYHLKACTFSSDILSLQMVRMITLTDFEVKFMKQLILHGLWWTLILLSPSTTITCVMKLVVFVFSPATSTMSPGTMSRALTLWTLFLSCRYTLPISGSYSFRASMAFSALRSWKTTKNISWASYN